MSTFKPSAAQQRFYDWVTTERGHCVLNAVAGAGKTTTILNGIELMRGTVWFGVYNKKMADEIKEKIANRPDLRKRAQFKANEQVTTSTFHSLGFGLVKSMTYPRKPEIDQKKVAKIVDQILLEKEAEANGPRDDLRALEQAIVQMVSMAKQRGFVKGEMVKNGLSNMDDVNAWLEMVARFDIGDTLEDDQINTAIAFARTVLRRNNADINIVDFDDMVYLPLSRPVSLKPWHQFNWVLVDEAQDTNPTRRALATMVLARGGRLVAVGDPHQAIYGFTGADNDSLDQITRQFDAIELPLTVTYRCPKAIVTHAQKWVSHITAHESAPEGAVLTLPYMDLIDNLQANDPNVNPSETAILCRYNKYLVGLCFKLIREGIAAKIEGRAIGEGLIKLATRWKSIKTVNALESKLMDYREREMAKAAKKQQEAKAERIDDEVATLITIIDRTRDEGGSRVDDVVDTIEGIFADGVSDNGMVTLCSAHKSKGLEWDTVFLLDREALMPSKFAKQDWQVEQEINLIYVAVTRAKKILVEVSGVAEERDPLEGK